MKIIITENQKNSIVDQILKSENIKYYFGYVGRSHDSSGNQYDSMDIWFTQNDGYQIQRRVHFYTKNNKIIKVFGHGNFGSAVDSFKYIPVELLNDYFIEKSKPYLEIILRMEYPS